MPKVLIILFVAIGGAFGTIFRYILSLLLSNKIPGFPLATFLTNIIGCLIAGILFGFLIQKELLQSIFYYFFLIGFCGAFTTFSTFAVENVLLLQEGKYAVFLLYTLLSVISGLALTVFGIFLGKSI
ncbi:MAG TPA: fluoride efflux transporter CrcB [Chitinophagaceae bacterium]|nr:fluoride efflux transporter CrcB [Chitinophagaceae bacterium]